MTYKTAKRLLISIFIAAIAYFFSQGTPSASVPPSGTVTATSTTPVTATSTISSISTALIVTNALVDRTVDGDTIVVKIDGDKDLVKVRLLGVNTPESVDPRKAVECFGKEASHFTSATVAGKRVRLDQDPQADEVDKYGRLLRNVVLDDGTDFNAKLVRDGYAYAYLSFPLNRERKAELSRLQAEAKAAERGLWNPKTCEGKQ